METGPLLVCQRGESIRPAGRSRLYPDRGEDDSNCKGIFHMLTEGDAEDLWIFLSL